MSSRKELALTIMSEVDADHECSMYFGFDGDLTCEGIDMLAKLETLILIYDVGMWS